MAENGLTQDFEAHVLFTFAQIPPSPALANRWARVKRWFLIAFVESWLAVLLFRVKVRLRGASVPLLPGVCDLLSRALFRVQIGDRVRVGPGLMITHGNVVIDGETTIGKGCQINPWVTIGLSNSKKLGFTVRGPTIGDHVHIGTGAKVLGPVTVGDYARIGANAVVVKDVPANTTVVGIPARPVGQPPTPQQAAGDASGRDERLAAHMRNAIVEFRLHRCSLSSLVDALTGSFEIASPRLRGTQAQLAPHLALLDRVAMNGAGQTEDVVAALAALDEALAEYR